MRSFFLLFLSASATFANIGPDWRRLTTVDGQGVNARAVALVRSGMVLLENEIGEQFETPLEVLSDPDRDWLRTWEKDWRDRAQIGKKLNKAIGHSVFLDSWRLWDEPAGRVAKRLKLREESRTPYSCSFRRYTGESFKFLNDRPYSVVAYGDDRGLLARMSLVFANKGDYFSTAGFGEDHFSGEGEKTDMKTFQDVLENDAKLLGDSLEEALGEGRLSLLGKGRIDAA